MKKDPASLMLSTVTKKLHELGYVLKYVKQVLMSCDDLLRKKQFCYILAQHLKLYDFLPDQDFYLCGHHMAEYIGQRRPLGGLVILLPRMFSPENKDSMDEGDQNLGKEMDILVELERLLIHANIPKHRSTTQRKSIADDYYCAFSDDCLIK
ncbi:hypothetical protein LOK49_LG04G03013, partial [Camellia lanceoleosa]